jgi:hypothetical protein
MRVAPPPTWAKMPLLHRCAARAANKGAAVSQPTVDVSTERLSSMLVTIDSTALDGK